MHQAPKLSLSDVIKSCCHFCASLEAAQTPADHEVLGKTGQVTAAIGPGITGGVRIGIRGGTDDYLAIAAHPGESFKVDDSVLVVGIHLPRTAIVRSVDPLTHKIAAAEV